jgi:hypothetical protein
VTQLYPQALGSFFVASNDSQGYGGGDLGTDRIENAASNSYFIVTFVSFAAEAILHNRCLTVTVSSCFTILAFSRFVTTLNFLCLHPCIGNYWYHL